MSSSQEANYLLRMRNKCLALPFGKYIFSKLFASKAPYFKTIKPVIEQMRPGYCELTFKKRKPVLNHIGTVHAIALCNGLEMAMGAMAESSIPKHLRWIPKGMNINYTAKANSDITVVAELPNDAWQEGDVAVPVYAKREDGTKVIEGEIILYVSAKPARK
ncbi:MULTISPECIES: hotdog fold domain-containing protein [Gammaproteobacteria]|uniref:hotdog fold domain-containing protein n=1 Tax=Gammaproteobacteria TaxID=1236 RepID=UPI000DCF6BAB|nr:MULTISPECIES: hotdog fold domain-containing protein [Gammaproteobacteria]RTE87746.1 DUF4442 domain-containing protein [Aliidiomarina sp. B3213]TCZ92472.1 DUF4442 domain-containing protein [Lysobacter sp. N42]